MVQHVDIGIQIQLASVVRVSDVP
eukprot:SAG22_NODE_14872_length_362_cov_1.558935_1_plen_23_part_10